ncbi:hypothetical protein QJS10_CPA16g00150 [Acorus calamus]|uniref:KAT8 regulatory NSL complex subunit 2 n=1 Tax=Acorus calamus TaxID=4465 RepID=A0AAV9D1S0_ACOCL|nr:hypothetical protein QJS10_CPA16g00150 [Acorus calamus]
MEVAEEDCPGGRHMSRYEVLRRRSRRVKLLSRFYMRQYWAMAEEVRVRHREYYWKYGKSPISADEVEEMVVEGGEEGMLGLGFEGVKGGERMMVLGKKKAEEGLQRCLFNGCHVRAMPLTSHCKTHILSDSKQTLYKACTFVLKSMQNGSVTCGKPVLRSVVPTLCTFHFQKAQKQVAHALKKAGLNNVHSSNKSAPKLHVLIAEYVRLIQGKRKEMKGP